MVLVTEIVDGVDRVAKLIDGVQKIAKAIKTGRDYVALTHPDVRADVVALCAEIEKTLHALAEASALVTRFQFTVAGPGVAHEPARFNNYLIENKVKESDLSDRVTQLRGRCSEIAERAERLRAASKRKGLRSLWVLFGVDGAAREADLSRALSRLYNEEELVYATTQGLARAITKSLLAVKDTLGGDPARVPAAEALLREHSQVFETIEASCASASEDFQSTVGTLH